MMKLTKKQATSVVIFVALMALAYFLRKGYNKRSPYELSPEPIKITSKDGDIFSLPYDIKCLSTSYYTKDLTPGGICGDQEFVRSQAEDYKIVDGIGGSLLN